jgi:hypothetical protein
MVGVEVSVGVGVMVGVEVSVGVGVDVAVFVGVRVAVAVELGEGLALSIWAALEIFERAESAFLLGKLNNDEERSEREIPLHAARLSSMEIESHWITIRKGLDLICTVPRNAYRYFSDTYFLAQ